jgi:hypothetical protein
MQGLSAAAGADSIARLFGIKGVSGRHALHTAVDAGLIDHGPARGRSAPRINPPWAATITSILLCKTNLGTTTESAPDVFRSITRLAKGGVSSIALMGDDQTAIDSGSFLDALTDAIEGTVDPLKGPAVAFGLQFCRGEVRAWAEWERIKGRVYFGVRPLPDDDLIQEARIGRRVISELHRIAVPKTTSPTQFAPEPAESDSSESPGDANRRTPFSRNQPVTEDSRERVTSQLDSGPDSPSSKPRTKGRSSAHVRNARNRCLEAAQP